MFLIRHTVLKLLNFPFDHKSQLHVEVLDSIPKPPQTAVWHVFVRNHSNSKNNYLIVFINYFVGREAPDSRPEPQHQGPVGDRQEQLEVRQVLFLVPTVYYVKFVVIYLSNVADPD